MKGISSLLYATGYSDETLVKSIFCNDFDLKAVLVFIHRNVSPEGGGKGRTAKIPFYVQSLAFFLLRYGASCSIQQAQQKVDRRSSHGDPHP